MTPHNENCWRFRRVCGWASQRTWMCKGSGYQTQQYIKGLGNSYCFGDHQMVFSNSCSKYYPRSFPFPPSEYTPYSGDPSWFLLLFLSLIWMNALTEINIRRSSQPCMSWVACLADDRQSRCVPRLRGWDRPHLPEWCWSSIYLDITGNILLDQGQCRVEY